MRFKSTRALVALAAVLCLGLPVAGANAKPRTKLPADYTAWSRVAMCESNAHWQIFGVLYPDPLGIDAANWTAYGGGLPEMPTASASMPERVHAIHVGDRLLRTIEGRHYRIPDQDGCEGSW
jgi:hypothetical protein